MNTRYTTGVRGYGSRYGGGGGCGSYDVSMVNRMMLKFRPIAPKPVASRSGFCDPRVVNVGRSGRNKRRYVRVNNNNNNNKRRARTSTSSEKVISSGGDAVVTLSLTPETPVEKISSRDGHVTLQQRPETVSFVTVERVTETVVVDTWADMGKDTCPRFVSDGGDRVVWTNRAYKEMAAGGDEMVVVGKLEGGWPAAFTCNVRVVTCRTGVRASSTLTVPCDAWRMGGGGYAWRLDVKAALCLGR